MRNLLAAWMMVVLSGCGVRLEDVERRIATALGQREATLAPGQVARARAQLELARASDGDERQGHLKAALAELAEARLEADRAQPRMQQAIREVRERRVQQAAEVEGAQRRQVDKAAATPVPRSVPAVRQWSADALEDALRLGAPLFIVDVGDERRCARARVMGAHCMAPARLMGKDLLLTGEMVVMGDGERPDDSRVDEALATLHARGATQLGVMREGMRGWKSDARAWVGDDRTSPGLRAVDVAEMERLLEQRGDQAWHLLDVRPAAQFAAGHLAGAVHVDLSSVAARVSTLPPGSRVLMCGVDEGASLEGARRALTVGGRAVAFLRGGLRAAVMAGWALEQNGDPAWVAQGGAP